MPEEYKFCDYIDEDDERYCLAHPYQFIIYRETGIEPTKCSFKMSEIGIDEKGEYYITHKGRLEGECIDFLIVMNEPENKEKLKKLLEEWRKKREFCDYMDDKGIKCLKDVHELIYNPDIKMPECSFNINEIKTDEKGEYYITHKGRGLGECVDFSIVMNKPENKAKLERLLED